MALRRVRGSKNYKAEDNGLREIGQSAAMGAASLNEAQRLVGNIESVAEGKYEAESSTVTAGWKNESRAGAIVRESEPHWRDWRDAVMVRVLDVTKVPGAK